MSEIQHIGVITNITPKNIKIKIERSSACGSCSSKKVCGMKEAKEMFVDIARQPNDCFQISDKVVLISKTSTGWKAILYGYILPFLVFISLIGGMLLAKVSEGIAAMSGLGGLAVYYFVLYLFRDKITKKCYFKIEKLATE